MDAIAERFWSHVDGDGIEQCWLWTGTKSHDGYGAFALDANHRGYRAHRYAYEQMVAPIPAGLQLDHLCRVRACVNPWHLEPVTQLVNVRRGARPAQTHCVHGHEFTPANTYEYRRGVRVTRICRECNRLAVETYRQKVVS